MPQGMVTQNPVLEPETDSSICCNQPVTLTCADPWQAESATWSLKLVLLVLPKNSHPSLSLEMRTIHLHMPLLVAVIATEPRR